MESQMDFNERLLKLAAIKETLMDERKFYLGRKDWPKVKIRTEALRLQAEQVARVRHLMRTVAA
jgi:hypothetical protein